MKMPLADLIGRLDREEYDSGDQFSAEDDPVMEAFKCVADHYNKDNDVGLDGLRAIIQPETKHLKVTEQDIQAFLETAPDSYGFIRDTETHAALIQGIFISVLAEKLSEVTLALKQPLHYIGAGFVGRQLTINGLAGAHAGYMLMSGALRFNDGVGLGAGIDMFGGYVTIQKRAGKALGAMMHGGVINCYGVADEAIGNQSRGGKIELFANLPLIGAGCGAKVLHNGVRVK